MFSNIKNCHNTKDFRKLAKQRLPDPIFHYIDGAADDEVTYRRNTEAYEQCDLVPNVLAGVENIDMSTTVMGQKLDMPLFLSPTALQRLFHHDGELAVGRAAEKFGTMFGISSLTTVSIEEIAQKIKTPKMFQLYVHKDDGLNKSMIDQCKESNFEAMALTVDTIVGGNRERDLYTGFTSPPKLTLSSLFSFATKLVCRIILSCFNLFSLNAVTIKSLIIKIIKTKYIIVCALKFKKEPIEPEINSFSMISLISLSLIALYISGLIRSSSKPVLEFINCKSLKSGGNIKIQANPRNIKILSAKGS